MRHAWVVGVAVCSALGVALHGKPARACGGCFHGQDPTPERESVVTDHRMAFSISRTQTVLWDQIRYTGSPAEFAWVLPIHEGARVELSRDEIMAALDASTQAVVTAPQVSCPAVYGGGSSGGAQGAPTRRKAGAPHEGRARAAPTPLTDGHHAVR